MKKEPVNWGILAITSNTDDKRLATKQGKVKSYEITVLLWKNEKALRKFGGGGKRTLAYCYFFGKPKRLSKKLYDAGRVHLTVDASDETIVHEVYHLTQHAEDLIGDYDEERAACRSERLFHAIRKFVRDQGVKE